MMTVKRSLLKAKRLGRTHRCSTSKIKICIQRKTRSRRLVFLNCVSQTFGRIKVGVDFLNSLNRQLLYYLKDLTLLCPSVYIIYEGIHEIQNQCVMRVISKWQKDVEVEMEA